MNVARALSLVVTALTVVTASSCDEFWAEFECGYGGPGCSATPGLIACSDSIALGETATVVVTYFDDTGGHGATLTSVTVSDPAVFTAEETEVAGELALTGVALGTSDLVVTVDGWDDQPFKTTFAVAARAPDGEGEGDVGEGEGEGEGEGDVCVGFVDTGLLPRLVIPSPEP
jgi:hypothetical protein